MNVANQKSRFLFAITGVFAVLTVIFAISSTAHATGVQQIINTASQTIDNIGNDNFSLGQTIGDTVSGTVNSITLHLKLTEQSYSQNSDHRIYLNFYRLDTGENIGGLLFSYLMSEADIGIEQDITFTPHGGIPPTFELGIPYAFIGNFKSATYYGSANVSAYAQGFAFYVGNAAGGLTENWPPTVENTGTIKDLYFVFHGLNSDATVG